MSMSYRHEMDVDALRWFQQVADGVTVTEVGEMYWVTQSGVSRGLARLEAEVGTPLLRRSGRTLRMTHAGAVFKRYVDGLLHDLDDGLAAVEQLIDPERGTVALATQVSLGTWLIPRLVNGFRQEHPSVRFVLEQARDELVSAVLGGGRVDLEIGTQRPADRTVQWHRLFTEPLRLAVPDGHRLARRKRVRVAELAEEPFVVLRPASLLRQQSTELCHRAGFAPQIAIEIDDVPTLRGMVAAGLGVAVVPAQTSAPETTEGVVLLAIEDAGASRDIGLAWSTERRLLPAADLFRRYVRSAAGSRSFPA
jgi:LysR family transcriptional regulator, transcription activator of glutamate synthase operon